MKKVIRTGLLYLKKHGLKKALGGLAIYCGRLLNPELDVNKLDDFIGRGGKTRGRFVGDWLLQFDIRVDDIEYTTNINKMWIENPTDVEKILWVIPDFRNVYNGGPHTILRFAHYFASQGITNELYVFNGHIHRSERSLMREICEAFGRNPNIKVHVNPYWREMDYRDLPDSDVAIATIWQSAYILLPYRRTKAKFYFVQDYERLFYPAGVEYGLADATYDFGYLCIFNTPGLAEAVKRDHNIVNECSFTPGIDSDIFFPPERNDPERVKRIFFYGRPGVPRNGFDLGIAGLYLIKEKFPDVTIYVAGHHSDYPNIDLDAKFLGYMDYSETGKLYRHCGVVIAFMFTPHPSYIPLQAMACGSVPIAISSPFVQWILRDKVNSLLVYPTPRAILEAYTVLRSDLRLYSALAQRAIESVSKFRWEQEMEGVYKWMTKGKRGH
jgi:glycosyltransferase involved in cell wall biosynthesis